MISCPINRHRPITNRITVAIKVISISSLNKQLILVTGPVSTKVLTIYPFISCLQVGRWVKVVGIPIPFLKTSYDPTIRAKHVPITPLGLPVVVVDPQVGNGIKVIISAGPLGNTTCCGTVISEEVPVTIVSSHVSILGSQVSRWVKVVELIILIPLVKTGYNPPVFAKHVLLAPLGSNIIVIHPQVSCRIKVVVSTGPLLNATQDTTITTEEVPITPLRLPIVIIYPQVGRRVKVVV